jgi:hypothetical protein
MPAKSKAQMRFMHGVAKGSIKKPGLSKTKAKEFTNAPYKKLRERVRRKKA